jgi:hypothetical protein
MPLLTNSVVVLERLGLPSGDGIFGTDWAECGRSGRRKKKGKQSESSNTGQINQSVSSVTLAAANHHLRPKVSTRLSQITGPRSKKPKEAVKKLATRRFNRFRWVR